ncbi:uncharacterized protein LOC117552006 isoform X2 [Gymnodraco acuticeps]|uniref:Uncharacterized protein LOC117552006 isoform X2 n=1 Tax=Gymnodraco acuticeps TaxID=8218 RepID=A0A6P8V6F3_GYMAC|nr:uncharacterized protein LOC117552006 isoform X2 [Gymnodraco acuticeps]
MGLCKFDWEHLRTLVVGAPGSADLPLPRQKPYGTRGPAPGVEPIDFTRSNELKGFPILGVGDPLLDCGFPFPPSLAVHLPAEEAAGPEAAITTKFPAKVDMSRIWACRQNREETVNDYYHRLEKVFIENSGIIKQEAGVGVWETHLSNAFLTGLSPAISSSVRNSCIGVMDGARLEEIRRHAVQAEKRLSEEKASEEKRRHAHKEKGQLTMVQVVTTTWAQGQGQGRGNRRGGRDRNRDRNSRCFNCGEMGHRFAECPHEKQKKNFRSDKSDCNKDSTSN